MTMLLPGMPVNYGMPSMGMMPMGVPQMGMMPMGAMPYGAPVMISSLSQLPPGAVPMSQHHLAQALGQGNVGAQVVQEKGSLVGSVLKGAGIGAAAGAAFGVIPFLPLGLMSGALVGAGVGAAIGLVKHITSKPKGDVPHILTQEQQQAIAQAQMAASTPVGARSAAATAPVETAPVRKKVVMGPEMRKRWAAKVRAERAAAAKAEAAAKR